MPPITAAVNPNRTGVRPIAGEDRPGLPDEQERGGAGEQAAEPERDRDDAVGVDAQSRAASKSSAAARICVPIGVRRRKRASAPSRAAVTTIVITVSQLTKTPPTVKDSRSSGSMSADFGRLVKMSRAPLCNRYETANDVISSVAGLAPRTGRNATRSVISAIATAAPTPARMTSGHHRLCVR